MLGMRGQLHLARVGAARRKLVSLLNVSFTQNERDASELKKRKKEKRKKERNVFKFNGFMCNTPTSPAT